MRARRSTPGTRSRSRLGRLICLTGTMIVGLPLASSAALPATGPPFTPTLHTQASPSVSVGGTINDSSSLVGQSPPTAPAGTIVFTLYGPNDATCAGSPVFTSPPITAKLTNTSGKFTPTLPGTYRWVATFTSSDPKMYNSTSTKCADSGEAVLVTAVTPTLTTTASPTVMVGGRVTDTATLTGGMNPTGKVEFGLFAPNDPNCTGGVVFRSTVAITDPSSVTSEAYSPPIPGTYHWEARYVGDQTNGAVRSGCNDTGESVVVTAAPGGPGGPPSSTTPGAPGGPPPACDVAATARALLAGLVATLTGKPGAAFRNGCSAGLRIVLRAKEIRPGNPGFPRRDGFTTMTNILTHIAPNGPPLNFALNANGLLLRNYAISQGRSLVAFLIVHVRRDKSPVSTESLEIVTLN